MTPASDGPFGTMSSGSRQASQYAKELVAAANPCKLLHTQPSGNMFANRWIPWGAIPPVPDATEGLGPYCQPDGQ